MGFLDKAKEAANQALASAQQAAQQGQAKLDSYQSDRSESDLHRQLGEAFYNEQRRGGDHAATVAALQAVDAHHAAVAAHAAQAQAAQSPVAQAPGAPQPPTGPAPTAPTYSPPAAAPAAAPQQTPPAGNFTLDDL
ncbi:hypothetical protein BH10ACT8_BH10ACT8_12990 [soil metagenome]|jgi:hypothetical protein